MKDLFSDIEQEDETVREVIENEDRFNSKEYYLKCKKAEGKKLFLNKQGMVHGNGEKTPL